MAYASGSFKSTPAQWGFFRKLTGHSLPNGCTKSQASRLIDKAVKGEWKAPLRQIEVGRWELTDWSKTYPVKWLVWVDHRTVGAHYDTQAEAVAAANALVRDGETVVVKDSVYRQLSD